MKKYRKTFTVILSLAILVCAAAAFSQGASQGYIKPELSNATIVHHRDLAPMRLVPQDVWYNAIMQDPRYGEYKIGYLLHSLSQDGRGNLVFTKKFKLVMKVYSVDFQTQEGTMSEKIDMETGRTVEISMKGQLAGYTYWLFGQDMPQKSMVNIEKKAVFNWNTGKITVTYGTDPRAPVRTYDIERDAAPPSAILLFMNKQFGRQEGKVYRFRYFDLYKEKYDDAYVKYEGSRGKDMHKYMLLPPGWGEQMSESYWFGPPKDFAPNGFLHKIITNPMTSRYTTFLPVTKEEALKPVDAMIE